MVSQGIMHMLNMYALKQLPKMIFGMSMNISQ